MRSRALKRTCEKQHCNIPTAPSLERFPMPITLLAIALLILTMSAMAFGQRSASAWENLAQEKGKSLVIVRNDGHSETGQLEQVSGASLTLVEREAKVITISQSDVRQIYELGGRSRKRGTLWGLAIGAGGGAIAGAAIVQPCSSNNCIVSISRSEGAAVGMAAGAAVGSIAGALVGGRKHKILLYDGDVALHAGGS